MDQGCWLWTRGAGSGPVALVLDLKNSKMGVLFSTHIPAITDFSVKTDLAEYIIIWWWLSSLCTGQPCSSPSSKPV